MELLTEVVQGFWFVPKTSLWFVLFTSLRTQILPTLLHAVTQFTPVTEALSKSCLLPVVIIRA